MISKWFTLFFQAGQDFIDWQKDNQICYFPYQKNLTYFDSYSQDNCLLECRVKKISTRCGCAPWFIPRNKGKEIKMGTGDSIDNLPVCTSQGNECFKDLSKSYNEDLIDRTECDCKNDCEMVHTFSTLQVNDSILYRKATYVNLCLIHFCKQCFFDTQNRFALK